MGVFLNTLKGHIQEKLVFNLNDIFSNFGQSYLKPILLLFVFAFLYMLVLYGYEENILSKIYEPVNIYIKPVIDVINNMTKNILPFGKFLKNDLEFVSLIFTSFFQP